MKEKQEVTFLDKYAIAERYDVGLNKALDIIRVIRETCGGGSLPAGKVLPSEVAYWENKYNYYSSGKGTPERRPSFQFDSDTASMVAEEILSAISQCERMSEDLSRQTAEEYVKRLHFVLSFYEKKYGVKAGGSV